MSLYHESNMPDEPRNQLLVVAKHCCSPFGHNGKELWRIIVFSYCMHDVLCVDTFEELMMWADMHCITIDKVIEDDEDYWKFRATIDKHLAKREMQEHT